MYSPKFPLKIEDLRKVIGAAQLKSVWKTQVRDAMRKQPIPDPLENLDFHVRLDANCSAIEAEICSASYAPRQPLRFLAEKSKGLCRQLVVPTAKDALVLQALSNTIWNEIKQQKRSKKSFYAPADHGFSKAIKGHTSEYGSLSAWLAFQQTIFGFADTKRFLVVTDIANYYDFISYEHLRNILASLSVVKEHALDLLIYTLSSMLWQPDYMPRVPVGLPQMNLDAPRLLAHCFLFEIDTFLESIPNVDFARFMDDMDIGVDTVSEAREVIKNLDLALQTRQLRLNSGKTRILTESEARRHFRIRENTLLNALSDRIEAKRTIGKSLFNERRKIEISIRVGLKRGAFSSGNGDKILKRLLNLARATSAQISDDHFFSILANWPSLRSTLLQWWQESTTPFLKLNLLTQILQDGHLVDDASIVEIASALVAARLPDNFWVRAHIKEILRDLSSSSIWSLYAQIWVASKYASNDELMLIIETKTSTWGSNEHLTRLVAGMAPRFLQSSLQKKFEAILRRVGGFAASSVAQFHHELSNTVFGYTAIRKFIEAPNTSLPNRISHAKFLMLLSLLRNSGIAPAAVAKLKGIHTAALSDPFYAHLVP
jgi:hypothetical protein